MTTITNNKLTDETLSAWKTEAKISLGETARDSVEYYHHEAILALVTEIQEHRKAAAEPVLYVMGMGYAFDAETASTCKGAVDSWVGEWNQERLPGQEEYKTVPLYTAPPASERERIRREHAEWSDKTFGDVGPIGPLKHLSKEALEAAADPSDPLEWADMQFLLWDAQRRMGISDEFVTRAMIEKLEINKSRQWPEPKDGEPRLHIKEQPAPVVPDEMATSDDMNLYQKSFAQGYNACRNAMLNAEPPRAIQTAPALDFLNKNAAPLHATPKGNRLRIAEGEFAAYFPQERPVSGARVIAWDESGHLLGIGFGRDTRESGIAIIVEGKKYDSNHIIHWCNYPAIPEGLNIRAIAALRAAVRNQWLKSDNFADKVYWKSMHSIANEIVEAMMKNEPHQPTENHIPSREAIIAGGVLVQCPRCYNDSYRLNVNGLTHYWCDKCANSITSESK